jgi:uncharacterized Zn finger protein
MRRDGPKFSIPCPNCGQGINASRRDFRAVKRLPTIPGECPNCHAVFDDLRVVLRAPLIEEFRARGFGPKGLMTLASAAAENLLLSVSCTSCGHRAELRFNALMPEHGADKTVPALMRALRCSNCGSHVDAAVVAPGS